MRLAFLVLACLALAGADGAPPARPSLVRTSEVSRAIRSRGRVARTTALVPPQPEKKTTTDLAAAKAPATALTAASTPGGAFARMMMCVLLLLTRVFQSANRNSLNLLLVFIAKDFDISVLEKGRCLAAIPTGYLFTQVPGGVLADKLGPKLVMAIALSLSASCCLAIPTLVAKFGLRGLQFALFCMGAVQGPLFPASSVYLSRWMPTVPGGADEKALGTSMTDIGISVGTLLIIPIANTLGLQIGWKSTYRLIGLATLAFVGLWWIFAADKPSDCWFIGQGELDFLTKYIKPPKKAAAPAKGAKPAATIMGLPKHVATNPGLWAVFLAHMAFNFGGYYLTNWSPTYYDSVLGLTPKETKLHLMAPHIANLCMKSISPLLVALVANSGFSLLSSRRIFTCISYALAAVVLAPAHFLKGLNPWYTTALFTVYNALFGFAPNGFRANYLDLTSTYIGIVSGIGNTLGTVSSWLGPQLVALILAKTGSWHAVLGTVAAANMAASVQYGRLSSVDNIDEE